MGDVVVFGTPASVPLAERLGATHVPVGASLPRSARIVVAIWSDELAPGTVDDLAPDAWATRLAISLIEFSKPSRSR